MEAQKIWGLILIIIGSVVTIFSLIHCSIYKMECFMFFNFYDIFYEGIFALIIGLIAFFIKFKIKKRKK